MQYNGGHFGTTCTKLEKPWSKRLHILVVYRNSHNLSTISKNVRIKLECTIEVNMSPIHTKSVNTDNFEPNKK